MRITKPGYYDLPMPAYLADPCPEPSLSTSTVDDLITRSPARARLRHPRLGGARDDPSPRADMGSAVHALALGGAAITYIDAADWRTKAAQTARDEAAEHGSIPLLARQREIVEGAADAATNALRQFGEGKTEVTMTYQHADVWLRGRADWMSEDGSVDIDLKTSDISDPQAWFRRTAFSCGYDVQAAIRATGHKILGTQRRMLALVVELEQPHDVSFVEFSGGVLDLATRKVERAAKIWRRCLDSDRWPRRSLEVYRPDLPPWAEFDFAARGEES
jgi:hypothetical protein